MRAVHVPPNRTRTVYQDEIQAFIKLFILLKLPASTVFNLLFPSK